MSKHIEKFGLQVSPVLCDFLEDHALQGTGISVDQFWQGLSNIVHTLGPKNKSLLEKRANIQMQIDSWHKKHRGKPHDREAYKKFLQKIGYLVPIGEDFKIDTANVDPEIARIAGPQLVVPIMNARYALNAANARWGSLYDALYGTDAMGSLPDQKGYDRGRGARVVAYARALLDTHFPIQGASHADIRTYEIVDGALHMGGKPLKVPEKFVGFSGDPKNPSAVVLVNNGLHMQLVFDGNHMIGRNDQANLADIRTEIRL